MSLIVTGRLNKQVGGELGISEITVKAHRGRMMRKMQARSVLDLASMIASLHQRASSTWSDAIPNWPDTNVSTDGYHGAIEARLCI